MNKFDQIWSLKPKDRSKVYVYNRETKTHDEKQIFRSYRSYLKIPPKELALKLPKSYMYDGLEPSVPNCLLEYTKDAWTEDPRYCLLYTSPSPRDQRGSRMPSSA